MRFAWLILLLMPFGMNAQMWFATDSSFTENPFYQRYQRGNNLFTRPLYSFKNDTENQYLVVNPWFDVKLSQGANKNFTKNGRGALVEGQHGRFRFFSGIQEVQEEAYHYQKLAAQSSIALRGHNRTKITSNGSYDYADFLAGLQYEGKKMRYSLGWHPVKIGSGLRPMLVSHLNTGFFNYQIAFTSENKKLTVTHGNGVLFGHERLQSNSNSEAGIKRSQFNWLNIEYTIAKNWRIALHTDANTKLYNNSAEQIRPTIKQYFPIPLAFDSRTKNRLAGEIQYQTKGGKMYVGAVNGGTFYGGFTIRKPVTEKLKIALSLQLTQHNKDSLAAFNLFGNNYASAYSQIDYDGLSLMTLEYQNVRFESSANYFKAQSSDGMNIFASLGYCFHQPSKMLVQVFVEKRQFPNDETYVGLGIRNNLGLNRNTY